MNGRKYSLGWARRIRLCPPPQVEADPMHKRHLSRHRSLCPYSHEEGEVEAWETLARKLGSMAPPPRPGPIGPGSLCVICQELGTWQEGLYYNPPAVLVLEETARLGDDLLVAQVYHDITLAGPGDLILSPERSPVGEILVESWNVYTLCKGALEAPAGKVDAHVLAGVRALMEDPEAYPAWAPVPPPLEPEDPRIYFREMELQVGYLFSAGAVQELLEAFEGPSLRLAYDSVESICAALRTIQPSVSWERAPRSTQEAVITARFPAYHYAMAASSTGKEALVANRVLLREGRIETIDPVQGEIHLRSKEPGKTRVGGRLTLPAGKARGDLLCFMQKEDGVLQPHTELHWDPQEKSFLASFKGAHSPEGAVFLTLIEEAVDDPL